MYVCMYVYAQAYAARFVNMIRACIPSRLSTQDDLKVHAQTKAC